MNAPDMKKLAAPAIRLHPNDNVLVAGGANVVCFTTGRGSAFGCKPAPSIKLATNTPM
jgi:altronate dehydratase